MIIQTQEQLNEICQKLSQKPYITIDTEFLRDKTYFSKLCLVQLSADDIDPVALDPIATNLDWAPFYDLMKNQKVLKVFHAARQDLEIFFQEADFIPSPLFDTQVAAMVCGYGNSIAYSRLVGDITGTQLAKNAQFTDWSRRPLSEKQLTYALNDVTYLRDVYKSLSASLEEQGRKKWVDEEMAILLNPETYINRPEEVWKRIKIRSDKPKVLAVLRELAAWREERAVAKNLPRARIVKDDILANIALYMPKDKEAMSRIRGLPGDIASGKNAPVIFKLIEKALKSSPDSWPQVKRGEPLPQHLSPLVEMLKLLLKVNCSQANVAPKVVASAKDIDALAREDHTDSAVMKGWRYKLFGKDALAMKKGQIALGLKDGNLHKYKIDA